MAVTCSFEKKMGTVKIPDHEGNPTQCDIWAGGNCMMVVTWGKGKTLQFFFNDMKHLKACAKDEWFKGCFLEADLLSDMPYALNIAKVLAETGTTVTIRPKGYSFE